MVTRTRVIPASLAGTMGRDMAGPRRKLQREHATPALLSPLALLEAWPSTTTRSHSISSPASVPSLQGLVSSQMQDQPSVTAPPRYSGRVTFKSRGREAGAKKNGPSLKSKILVPTLSLFYSLLALSKLLYLLQAPVSSSTKWV